MVHNWPFSMYFKAWGNKTKEINYSFLSINVIMISFVGKPPSWNYDLSVHVSVASVTVHKTISSV